MAPKASRKLTLATFVTIICALQPVASAQKPLTPMLSQAQARRLFAAYDRLPMSFEVNRGQTAPQVRFLARGRGYTVLFTKNAALLELATPGSSAARKMETMTVRLVGAKAEAQIEGRYPLPGKVNYLIGANPKSWQRSIPTFAKVVVRNVYPNIDLVYHGNQGRLEYDFIVHPGAQPKAIQLAVKAMAGLRRTPGGAIALALPDGRIRLRRPHLYQLDSHGRRLTRSGGYLFRHNQIGFWVGDYNRSQDLVIDPVLDYSTYVSNGGIEAGVPLGLAVDGSGAAYICGGTPSATYPTTIGAYQTALKGSYNVFVTKLNASGGALLYSTFVGGSNHDIGNALALDSSGNAYVTGTTDSADFPVVNPYQSVCAGCDPSTMNSVAFVFKLNASGSALAYSTFFGQATAGMGIAVDASGNAYVAGQSGYPGAPLANPISSSGGVFLSKFNASGNGLVYSTLMGANSYAGYGVSVALDGAANAYVAATSAPATAAYTQLLVVGVNSSGASFLYTETLGGTASCSGCISPTTRGTGIAADTAGDAYVTGYTNAAGYPTTAGAFSASCGADGSCGSGNFSNAVVTKLSSSGAVLYSSYLGVSSDPAGRDVGTMASGIAIDGQGDAYVAGTTQDPAEFPVVNQVTGACPGCATLSSAASLGFVAEFNPSGSGLIYSTLLGTGSEGSLNIAVDTAGEAYVVGDTSSTAFPVTPGAFETSGSGSAELFAVKLASAGSTVTLSPTSLAFTTSAIGVASAAQTITLTNNTASGITISAIQTGGANAADFTTSASSTCLTGAKIAGGGGSCTLSLAYVPSSSASESATLSITDDAGTQTATLSGSINVVAPVVKLLPVSLVFGAQTSGTASAAQAVTMSNTGNAPLTISNVSINAEFQQTNNCGGSLGTGASCTFQVSFAPLAAGSYSGTLTITDNAGNSPQSVTLSGSAAASTTLGTWSALNTSNASPAIGALCCIGMVSDGQDDMILFDGSNNGSPLNQVWVLSHADGQGGTSTWTELKPSGTAPSGRANAYVVYDTVTNRLIIFGGCEGGCTPVANDVWVLSNANGTGGTPAWTHLNPSGTPPAPRQGGVAAYDSANNRLIIFGGQDGGGSGGVYTDTWVLTNANGTGSVAPSWIALSPSGGPPPNGYFPGSFYDAANNRLVILGGSNTSSDSNAIWTLSNANGLGGTAVWTNTVAQGATGAPGNFDGTYIADFIDSGNYAWVLPQTGGPMQNQLWELANANGLSTPTWSQVSASGMPTGIGFVGMLDNPSSGILSALLQNPTSGSATVYTLNTQVSGGAPAVAISPATLGFGPQIVGTSSADLTATLSNSGNASLTISGVTITGANPSDFALDASTTTCSTASAVAAGSTCTIGVTFSPASGSARSAAVSVGDNAAGSPQIIALSGTGEDFALGVASGGASSVTISAGSTATYGLSLAPEGGFNQPVALACSGAPALSSCTVTPSSATLDGSNAAAIAVSVKTTASSAVPPFKLPREKGPLAPGAFVWIAVATLSLAAASRKSRPSVAQAGRLAGLLLLAGALAGCGGGSSGPGGTQGTPGTPSGTYTIKVTGTAGNLTHSTTLTLVVQ